MKRIFLLVLILGIVFSPMFAGNMQQTYSKHDALYQEVEVFTRRVGVVGPSGAYPVSGDYLLRALEQAETLNLTEAEQREYDRLFTALTSPRYTFDWDDFIADFDLTVNMQANAADYSQFDWSNFEPTGEISPNRDRRDEVLTPFKDEIPFVIGTGRFFFSPYVMLEGSYFLGNNGHHLYESSLGWLVTKYDGTIHSTFLDKEGSLTNYSVELPFHAGLSTGGRSFSLIMGRYKHSYGNGVTGNMGIGDNFKYQEVLKASFMSKWFDYDMSITHFDRMRTRDAGGYTMSREEFGGRQQFRVFHQLGINFFNKVRFSFALGTLYDIDNSFDFRFLIPFMPQHNYGNYTNETEKQYFDEANNIMVFYLDAALYKGLSFHGQFVLDQWQTPAEESGAVPSAFGLLANLKYVAALDKGNLDNWIEFVYTNPYLYLNGKKTENVIDHNLDYLVGYHSDFLDDVGYTGYISGPDSIVIGVGSDYSPLDARWSIGGSVLYRIKGEMGYRIQSMGYHDTLIDVSNNFFTNEDGKNPKHTPSGVAEHMIQLKLSGDYTFKYNFKVYGGFYLGMYINYNNIENSPFVVKPMGTIGVSWSL